MIPHRIPVSFNWHAISKLARLKIPNKYQNETCNQLEFSKLFGALNNSIQCDLLRRLLDHKNIH
jgi:hypothetical protein